MSIFSALIEPVTNIFTKRGEAKHKEIIAEHEKDVLETTQEHQENIAEVNAAGSYDLEALKQKATSYLDDYYGLIWSFPIIASFIPFLQTYVASGWIMLATVPIWYQTVLIGIIASTFGLRWLLNKK